MSANPIYVLYHADCTDGFGAAWSAWQKFGGEAVYIPVKHGEAPPEIPDDAQVFILDFSYPRKTLLNLYKRVATLVVIDHHATAADDLKGLAFARFDMTKSGAVLAWEYFVDSNVPTILKYVQDRDLWKFKLPNSHAVAKALQYLPKSGMDAFPHWQLAAGEIEGGEENPSFAGYVTRGEFETQLEEFHIANLCRNVATTSIGGYDVPTVNSPVFQSEIAHSLLQLHPDAPFVAVYYVEGNGNVKWSLRSRSDFDCSTVAKQYGGGGHPQACGFGTKAPALIKEKKTRAKAAPVESD